MKRFLLLISTFIGLPLVVMISLYVFYDPFSVLGTYDNYNRGYLVNLDYTTTTMFNRNYDKYHYDSFIFGSSRCLAYKPDEWTKYIGDSAKPYVFNASAERIQGIHGKIQYLDKKNVEVKNVLIMLDPDLSFMKKEFPGHLYIKHPDTSDVSWLDFHESHLKSFLAREYFFAFIKVKMLNNTNPKVLSFIEAVNTNDTITNQMRFISIDARIEEDKDYYKQKRFGRKAIVEYCEPQIDASRLELLHDIKAVFDKQDTNYKIIINPTFYMQKFAEEDMEILNTVFGADHVCDFSGKNKFTESIQNYYEESHFKTPVGDSILNVIYR